MQSNYLEVPIDLARAASSAMHCIDCGATAHTSRPFQIVPGAAWLADHIRRVHHREVASVAYALAVYGSLVRN